MNNKSNLGSTRPKGGVARPGEMNLEPIRKSTGNPSRGNE
jgi:hypothetical protein